MPSGLPQIVEFPQWNRARIYGKPSLVLIEPNPKSPAWRAEVRRRRLPLRTFALCAFALKSHTASEGPAQLQLSYVLRCNSAPCSAAIVIVTVTYLRTALVSGLGPVRKMVPVWNT